MFEKKNRKSCMIPERFDFVGIYIGVPRCKDHDLRRYLNGLHIYRLTISKPPRLGRSTKIPASLGKQKVFCAFLGHYVSTSIHAQTSLHKGIKKIRTPMKREHTISITYH